MACVYCSKPYGVTIPIGSGLLAHRECFDAADRRSEALECAGGAVAPPEPVVRYVDHDQPIGPKQQPGFCACGCGETVPPRVGRGPKSPYLNELHYQRAYRLRTGRAKGPRHIGSVLVAALARIPGRPE